jgi:hypothetical protein
MPLGSRRETEPGRSVPNGCRVIRKSGSMMHRQGFRPTILSSPRKRIKMPQLISFPDFAPTKKSHLESTMFALRSRSSHTVLERCAIQTVRCPMSSKDGLDSVCGFIS